LRSGLPNPRSRPDDDAARCKNAENPPAFLAAATGSEQVGTPEQGDPADRGNVPGPALRVERDRYPSVRFGVIEGSGSTVMDDVKAAEER
jgi:hypothetical protein